MDITKTFTDCIFLGESTYEYAVNNNLPDKNLFVLNLAKIGLFYTELSDDELEVLKNVTARMLSK